MTGVVLTAKLRLDTWQDSDLARAGIGLCCDPQTGRGLNLVFHGGRLQFVHDYVTWGPGREFPYKTGKWYWLKLCKTAGELDGKAWLDGDAEPAGWTTTWSDFDEELRGCPALVGCSGGPGAGPARVSFAQCSLTTIGGISAAAYARQRACQEWKDSNLQSLRLAVEDLMQTYGRGYAKGPEYLRCIVEVQKALVAARDRQRSSRSRSVLRGHQGIRDATRRSLTQ